jgi:hypothetical protein
LNTPWTKVGHVAALYTANANYWDVIASEYAYQWHGSHTLNLSVGVSASTHGGGATALGIRILGDVPTAAVCTGVAFVQTGGVWEIVTAIAAQGSPVIYLQRNGFVPYPTGAVQAYFSIVLPL